jgi:putative ABC transport system permease protein
MSAFRAALRLSLRDARRAKGRSALIMVMIGLPVLVATAVLTHDATVTVSPGEDVAAELGAADARIVTTGHTGPITQPVHGRYVREAGDSAPSAAVRTADEVTSILDARLLPYDQGTVEIREAGPGGSVGALELDLRDPMTRGIRRLTEGRLPAEAGEVVVSPALAEEGLRVGGVITVTPQEHRLRVVGVVEHPHDLRIREVVGLHDTLLPDKRGGRGTGWLADTDRPVLWEDVRRLNGIGMLVTSRAVLADPPPGVPGDPYDRPLGLPGLIALTAFGVLVVMEIALLAGPAFAVGLRRRRRELALVAAQGGSGRHLKLIVLADGLVLGGVASLAAAALGTGGTLALMPLLRQVLGASGPPDVPWGRVLGVAALGLAAALAAALVPAVSAARQDPARVLAGREDIASPRRAGREGRGGRADREGITPPHRDGDEDAAAPSGAGRENARPRRARLPLLAVLLLAGGPALAAYALLGGNEPGPSRDPLLPPAGALVVLGLVALVPSLVTAAGGLAGRLPPALRLSVRDAARNRTRTASAAAAVMAATMGAVTLGIAAESAIAAALVTAQAHQPPGSLRIAARHTDDRGWADLRAAAGKALPGVPLVPGGKAFDGQGDPVPLFGETGCPSRCLYLELHIGDARLLSFLQGRADPRAAGALADGKAVVFDPGLLDGGDLTVLAGDTSLRLPAVVAEPATKGMSGAVIPPAALERAGYPVAERVLYAAHRPDDPQRLQQQLSLPTARADVTVADRDIPSTLGTFWWAFGLALLLGVGGTLAATGLAAADLRRDLDTIAAVGGPPRVRRTILAVQAGFVAGLGAVVGAAGGAVMGAVVAVPVTRGVGPAVVAVPWTAVTLVVLGPPVLAALLAGLVTRGHREPLARRLG